jgi:DnaJ-class molecular chaperone
MAKPDENIADISDYYRVVRFLATLQCAACGGSGSKGVGKRCVLCEGTGFREGDVHYVISARQVRIKGRKR